MRKNDLTATGTLAVIVLSLVAGCNAKPQANSANVDGQRESSNSNVARQSIPVKITVALLGDGSRVDLLESIASSFGLDLQSDGKSVAVDVPQGERTFQFRATRDEMTVAQARLAWEADLVLLAINATDGHKPVHREHMLLARQMAVPVVAVAFTNSQLIDDSEHLKREELEIRELLNNYELPGDHALCVLDHADAKSSASENQARGPQQIVSSLATVAKRRASEGMLWEGKRVSSVVFVLGPAEVDSPETATKVQNARTTVLMRGELFAASTVSSAELLPGSVGDVDIVFEKPAEIAEAQRFVLLNNGHISALGVITSNPHR